MSKITGADLRQFTGSEQFFRHSLNRKILYTEGIQYLAEQAGAYWLVDDIAIANMTNAAVRSETFQTWKLKKTGDEAVLSCEDGNSIPVYSQEIQFTDFPLDQITLWCVYNGEGHTIMLPSEY